MVLFDKKRTKLRKNLASLYRNKVNYGYPEQTIFSMSEPVTDVGHKTQTVVRPQCKKDAYLEYFAMEGWIFDKEKKNDFVSVPPVHRPPSRFFFYLFHSSKIFTIRMEKNCIIFRSFHSVFKFENILQYSLFIVRK